MNNVTTRTQKIFLAAALLILARPVPGAVIGTSIVNGDGSVTYSYVVDNRGGAFDISAWSLDFNFSTPDWDQLDVFSGGSVGVPSLDWFASAGIPVTGRSAQDFLSLSPLGDVLVGQILTGFSFTSNFLPGPLTYREFSAAGEASSGTVIGPAHSVPDGGEGLAAIALVALAGFALVERRRSRAIPRMSCAQ